MTSLIRYVPVSEASMAHRLPLMLPFREGDGDQNPSAGGDGCRGGVGDGDGSGDGTGGGGGSGGGLGGGRSGTASGEYSTRCGGSSSAGGGGGGGSSDGTTAVNVNVDGTTAVNVNVDGTTAVPTVGSVVTARWKARGSKWFGARVKTINDDGTFRIMYDDGDEDHKVSI